MSFMSVVVRPWTLASLQSRGGTRRVFTDQVDIACMKSEAPVRCWASRMKGELEKPFCEAGFLAIWLTASNKLICFVVWPLPETAMGILCSYFGWCLTVYTLRDAIIPLVRSYGLSTPRI